MSTTLDSLDLGHLSIAERLDLMERIWDSLPEQLDPSEIPPRHLAELAARRAEAESSPGAGTPWRKVLEQLGTKP